MAESIYNAACRDIMDILAKYEIESALILIASHNEYEGHIHGNPYDLSHALEMGADLKQINAIDCRNFINQVNKIKLC